MDKTEMPRKGKRKCVVIFASEDEALVRELVGGLRSPGLDVWWSEDLNHGKWANEVRAEIEKCDAVIPIVTRHTRDKGIFADEWRFAETCERPIFPFVVDKMGTPFGMGGYSRTDATGWTGDHGAPEFLRFKEKLAAHFGRHDGTVARPKSTSVGHKSLLLPSFVFSLSSFETQLHPIDGLDLMANLAPAACLVSAYDVRGYVTKRAANFRRSINALHRSSSVVFLDSGHYEATRKDSYQSPENADGWSAELFWEAANSIPADIVFSYDNPEPKGPVSRVIDDTFKRYIRDWLETGLDPGTLCPIVHVPTNSQDVPADAAFIIATVAHEIRPTLIAVPERELGDGVLARMKAVKTIRRALDELGYYQPLHILGTGNPITIAALSACGGDSFDGLEWCRTAANYETNNLMHFQQCDLMLASFGGRMSDPAARRLIELDTVRFAVRAASYNYDYFCHWMEVVQHSVHSDQPEQLLRSIHYLGAGLTEAYLHD